MPYKQMLKLLVRFIVLLENKLNNERIFYHLFWKKKVPIDGKDSKAHNICVVGGC
jgi:hypothetical protein